MRGAGKAILDHPTFIPRNLHHITRPPGQARVSSDNTAAPGKQISYADGGHLTPLGPFLLHVVLSTPAFSCFAERFCKGLYRLPKAAAILAIGSL